MYRIGWTDEVAGWYSCLHGEERQDRVLDGGGKGDTEQSSLTAQKPVTHTNLLLSTDRRIMPSANVSVCVFILYVKVLSLLYCTWQTITCQTEDYPLV